MTQADLWLPGFEFADALFGTPTQTPTHTPTEPLSGELFMQESTPQVVPVITNIDDSTESFSPAEPAAPTLIQAQAAVATETEFAEPPWPELTPQAHDSLKGQVTKFDANVTAIELLRQLETDGLAPNAEQRTTLNRYTGWGGIKQPFDKFPGSDWVNRTQQLKKLLSEPEFTSARDSTLNAHFTPLALIAQMWAWLRSIGFAGGRILEPSAGVGYMLGTMPSDIAQRSRVTAVEIDNLSARFLQALYGNHATVHHKGFEKVTLPEQYYDLVVSNVPFGNYGVGDTSRKPYASWKIHNYFIGRSLDLVRPGGLVAVITSAFFMDSKSENVRDVVARKAKLLGALRLPAGTFSQIASTDVVADLIILQKREAGEVLTQQERELWVPTSTLLDADGKPMQAGYHNHVQQVNNYWQACPQAVIGTWTSTSQVQGQAIVPKLPAGTDFLRELDRASSLIPAGVYTPASGRINEVTVAVAQSTASVLPGSFVIEGAQVYRFNGHSMEKTGFVGKKAERISAMVRIRDNAQALINEQCKLNADEARMATLRYELNVRYDSLVSKNGPISSKGNRQAMASDPAWPLLISLEFYNSEDDTATKADIFFERTVFSSETPKSAENAEDALAICQAELGCIDADYVGKLLAKDGKQVLGGLAAAGVVFIDPQTMAYQSASEYLSGNVRQKLKTAMFSGVAFDRNVQALKNALPEDLKPTQIDVIPGGVWIPQEVTKQFLQELVAEEWQHTHWASVKLTHEPTTGMWGVEGSGPSTVAMNSKWGTSRANGFSLFEMCMNQIDAEIKDAVGDGSYVLNVQETAQARMKQDELRAEYARWIWADDDRATRLCRLYNDEFNCWAIRKFDGSRLRLPGYSQSLKLREFQSNAVARIATGGNTLLAHVVGAGKSLEMICGSMELRRLGTAKKPFHVVPNHMLLQYSAEFMRAYPNASVLMATKDDFRKDKRQAFMARCATGNWDAVLLTHSMFERISADQDMVEDYIKGLLSELRAVQEDKAMDRVAARAVNKFMKDWQARLEKLQSIWKKDQLISLAQCGADYLFFDECHMAKNLFRISSMKSIAGLSNSNSQRSFDLLLKCMQIMRLHGDKERGLCFASGTVVSNSMAELHVSQRFLQPYTLAAMGLDKFDAWAAQFGRAVNSMEVSPDGSSFRMNKRFKQFVNMPELLGLYRQVADIQTREMLNLPVPKLVTGKHQIMVIEPSPEVKAYVKTLVERAEAIRNRQVKPEEDNMLAITGDGQKVALDMRLIDPTAAFEPNGKVAKCVDNVYRIWEQTAGFKGTQIIFSDMGTPTGRSINLYEEIRTRLVAKGMPHHEIEFIHDANTDHAKAALFAKVRSGKVRVLIGSTAKCGMGTNVQTLLYAVHHLTTPWRPSDIEQRDGRIERQGNTCSEVEIWRYVTEGSFDSYMWQTLVAKAGFIAQVMSGNAEVRSIEDAMMATLSFEEVKALACGNPAVREKATIDAQIMGLSLKHKQHRDSVWSAKQSLWSLPNDIASSREVAMNYTQFNEEVQAAQTGSHVLEIEGKKFSDFEKIEKIITLSIAALVEKKNQILTKSEVEIGSLNGLSLVFVKAYDGFVIQVVSATARARINLGEYQTGRSVLRKFDELGAVASELAQRHEGRVNYLIQQGPVLERTANSEFGELQKLDELRARSKEIAIEMGLFKAMAGTEVASAGTEIASALAAELAADEEGTVAPSEAEEEESQLVEID